MRNLKIKITKDKNGLVTKEFAKQANIFGTPEYKAWREFLEVYPNAEMQTKDIKRNPDKKTFRNLTYNNITVFINAQDNANFCFIPPDNFPALRVRNGSIWL